MSDDKHKLEIAAKFFCNLVFVNHQKQFTEMQFSMPPGVHPHPDWLPELLNECYREGVKALKLQTKDLSWRRPSISEFLEYTTGERVDPNKFHMKWVEPYGAGLEMDGDEEVANDDVPEETLH